MFCFELFGAMIVLDQPFADAAYGTSKSLATVGPNPDVDDGPKWFKVAIAVSVLLTLISAACFTGGLINRLVDSRLTGLIGKRAVPRFNHVIVVGLGQVGLRLCMLLRECGVLVVAVDADENSETVGLARRLRIPVVIGRGANPEELRRLSLGQARAFAAVTNEDLVNLEAAMTARSINGELRVVLRAGDGKVSEDTRSLARIGHVVDVHRLAAAYIAGIALGSDADSVVLREGRAELLRPGGERETAPLEVAR
jgi:voltage-gated potassium channel Kch